MNATIRDDMRDVAQRRQLRITTAWEENNDVNIPSGASSIYLFYECGVEVVQSVRRSDVHSKNFSKIFFKELPTELQK